MLDLVKIGVPGTVGILAAIPAIIWLGSYEPGQVVFVCGVFVLISIVVFAVVRFVAKMIWPPPPPQDTDTS